MKEVRRQIIVSFSGIDGAGKSTQIENLSRRLSNAGLRVKVLAFWDDVAVWGHARGLFSHAIFKSEKGVGSPQAPVRRRDKNVRAWYMTPVRFFVYVLDALSLYFATRRIRNLPADVVIFDRYLYDELANLRLEHYSAKVYARWLMKLAPRPNIPYLLDADPTQARKRKPEYPIEFLFTNRRAYLALSAAAGMTVIAPDSEEAITRSLAEDVLAQCRTTA